jgi:hypothetical protein
MRPERGREEQRRAGEGLEGGDRRINLYFLLNQKGTSFPIFIVPSGLAHQVIYG